MTPLRRITALALVVVLPAAARAQAPLARPRLVPADTAAEGGGKGTLLTRRDITAAALLGVATLALLPADRQIAEEFRDPAPQRSAFLRDGARAFNFLGDPGTLLVGVATFGVGRVTHSPHLTDLGLHTTEAIVVSGAVTGVLKGVLGRQRPFLDRNDSDAFALGRGFGNGNRASLPSGHATAAFATAAAVTEETRHWWPKAPWVVGPVLYGGAALVGLARMYDDKHWASDVVLGAGIGTISGLSVVRYNHERPRNRVDRWLGVTSLVPAVAPAPGGGVSLAWRAITR
jgi:membrane-associated phospholipid phosphatase